MAGAGSRATPAPLGRRTLAVLGGLVWAACAAAAPLDALRSATPERSAERATLALGVDKLTRTLDFSTSREGDPLVPGSRSGDYRAAHVTGALRVADGIWLDGGLWQRRVQGDVDVYRYTGWLLGSQFRLRPAEGAWPALALRLSAWGNRADQTVTTTPVRVPGAVLNSVTVNRPADRQLQADLLATWPLTPAWDLTAQLGLGRNRLSYGALTATTTRNGCPYDLSFTGNDIFGNLAGPCVSTGGGVIRQFFDSSGDYGVDVANEIAWRGSFVQLGLGAAWRGGPWQAALGYVFHAARRDAVDDILAGRGDPTHKQNRTLVLDGAYAFTPQLGAWARLQLSSNLFLDEIPVTYNSSTSRNFGSKLSLLSLGLRATF
ncbi:MAG: hypothetical protein Q8K45_18385 [Rubrivivax sp.]|nr:hypothetical protein [Rubrivivax sp.]